VIGLYGLESQMFPILVVFGALLKLTLLEFHQNHYLEKARVHVFSADTVVLFYTVA